MAHFQIGGGWKALAVVCVGYLVVVGAISAKFAYTALGTPSSGFSAMAVTMILIMQTLALLFFGNFRIAGAIRTDMNSKMIESHRLMPISSARAMIGYMLGGAGHAILFTILNVLLAYTFAAFTGTNLAALTLNELVLAIFVLFIWSASLLAAFHGKLYGALVGITVSCSFTGGFYLYGYMPGLALLMSPLIGGTIFSSSKLPPVLEWAYPAAFAAQAAFIAIFFAGACRAYRGTYSTTFNLVQALGLTWVWSAVSIAGIVMWDHFHMNAWRDGADPSERVIASLIAAMLIALVPLRTLTIVELHGKSGVWKSVGVLVAVVGGIMAIAVAPMWIAVDGMGDMATMGRCLLTLVVIGSHVACVYLIFRVMRRAKGVPTFFAVAILGFVLWVGPLLVELMRYWLQLRQPVTDPNDGAAAAFSPVVLLGFIWTADNKVPLTGALVWVGLVPVLLALVVIRAGRRKAVRAVPEPVMARLTPALEASAVVTADRPESLPS
jgi:hypothetical protein